jgi:hypothetical protein
VRSPRSGDTQFLVSHCAHGPEEPAGEDLTAAAILAPTTWMLASDRDG